MEISSPQSALNPEVVCDDVLPLVVVVPNEAS